ncbi:HAD family hydrolase [Metabacillus litoralis]|uniref:HAD family hydrolase n=1 Tax=Metabacillus litoralis TaxID=152268 RepID=UPI001CFCAB40|nr:HAD family hydrolase [Metabacillus litoralis]
MLFDLDDTLLNRDEAVDKMFFIILEKCYGDVKHSVKTEMIQRFKEYDKESYGYDDKTIVFKSLFDEFPPKYRLPHNNIQDFWNTNFPQCFLINQNIINLLNTLKSQVKVAIITNGSTQRQKAKLMNTNLNSFFDVILISEEEEISKPDKRIFELALDKLNVHHEDALFVGDDIEKDIGGCQNANIHGIWFNPHNIKNHTDIKPYAEINYLDRLLSYIS